jgi:predicted nuclease with TOPRIM domain
MNIDIVNLIENNPITKLNGIYQNKLIEKVKNNFNNYEQQLFVASFYCYLKYDNTNDYVIDLDDVWEWLGFSQKVKSKQLLEKNFIINKDYKLLHYQQGKHKNEIKGGHNKQTFMLNVKTFKLFCIKAGTKKANEIHEYFVNLEGILQEIFNEECNDLKKHIENVEEINNKLIKNEELKDKEYEDTFNKIKIIEREKILLKEYANIGAIIYIIKVKTFENGQYIVKIGESRRGVLNRYNEHKKNYEECILLDCFLVQKSKDFESFVHNHDNVRNNKVNNLEGHETEIELFLIGKNLSYQMLLNIINTNIKYFNNNDTSNLELEIEKLKLLLLEVKENNNDNLLISDLINTVKKLNNKLDNLENSNKEILNKLNSLQTKTTNNFNEPLTNLGPRLQKINPETLELIHVYENVSECLKENNKMKRPSIAKAVQENTIYNGFRWQLIDRDLDPYILNIEPTKEITTKNIGYISKLNSNKTEILNVYLDRKVACKLNGYASVSGLDNPVSKGTITNGNYYILYDKCSIELRNNFENNYGNPILYKDGIGQYDKNNILIKEFECKNFCCKSVGISDKSLNKSLEKNIMYNNFYYKHICEKLSIL